ncbi:MAG: transporter substrate-binding domain-containing protein [Deltaproteobacteria bacterium]|nr:transporter substrate-binding domain-containing protein [Deltaproteobacteria bacterium]
MPDTGVEAPVDAGPDAGDAGAGEVDASVDAAPEADAGEAQTHGTSFVLAELQDTTTTLPPPPPRAPPTALLRVALTGSEPFVVSHPDGPTGISVEVFDAIATRARINYRFVHAPSAAAAIAAVARGDVDLAVGPISITAERAQHVDFTQPYFLASLGIASPQRLSLWQRAKPFLSRAFIVGVAGLSFVLLVIGTLIWLLERRRNPEHFPKAPLQGIANGAWFALVTMTTVGYGDKAPITLAGRVVAGVWMVVSMVIASSLIAGIATALTLARVDSSAIESADELSGKDVAVVRGTTAIAFVRSRGGRPVVASSLQAALADVSSGRASAIVFDRPALSYAIAQDANLDLTLAEASYEPQGYGFAIATGSALGHRLDVALLDFAGSRQMELIRAEWLAD